MCCRKHTLNFPYRTSCCCEILMEISFSPQIFEKLSLKCWVRADGWTDRHTYIHKYANSNFSQFYESK